MSAGKKVGQFCAHFFTAVALAALVIYSHWFVILATFIYAWLREQGQHRYEIEFAMMDMGQGIEPVRLYTVEKSTFFGWMTWHRMWEVFQWTLGSALACGGWWLIQFWRAASIPLQ